MLCTYINPKRAEVLLTETLSDEGEERPTSKILAALAGLRNSCAEGISPSQDVIEHIKDDLRQVISHCFERDAARRQLRLVAAGELPVAFYLKTGSHSPCSQTWRARLSSRRRTTALVDTVQSIALNPSAIDCTE